MPENLESRSREECYKYSSLLYSKDKNKEFIHDTHKDFFLALAIAKSINNKGINVHDALFAYCPVIQMEADLLDDYDTDRVNLLPNWVSFGFFVYPHLSPLKAREVIDEIWDQFTRGISISICTDKQYESYFEYPQFCAELIKECHSFPNGIDSKGSYYLVKCIEEVHYKPDPSPFWDSWSVPQLAIKAASINNVMEKVQSIVNRWMDIQVRSPSNARYDLSYITHIFKVEDHLGKILHKKDIHDICSLYP